MINQENTANLAVNILDDFTENNDVAEIKALVSKLLLSAFCSEMELTSMERIKIAEGFTSLDFLLTDIERYKAEQGPINKFHAIRDKN